MGIEIKPVWLMHSEKGVIKGDHGKEVGVKL